MADSPIIVPAFADDIRLSGSWTGDEPGWTDRRVETWLRIFMALGIALRLVRFGLKYPLWADEAYLAWNLLDRDFVGLIRPLDYQQVCPLLFLWGEKAISVALGFNEWSLRLLPTIAAIASLVLFRHFAGRLLKGVAWVIAVAILAIGYTPIRHGGEIKPYATDFLVALGLIALAVEWLRTPERTGFLWGLAALGPPAVGISNPAIFVAGSVGLVLAIPVLKTRSSRAIAPFALFGVASVATFLVLLRWVTAPQSASVMQWMRVYWAGAFPPRSPVQLLGWLVRMHTSQMFAYPAGGDIGASTLTTCLVAAAITAYVRRGSKTVLALLLTPFALGLIAASLGRYPYGGSARTMQYVAPAIILMAGLGAAVLLARLPRPRWRERSPRLVMWRLLAIGLGMMAWDATHPYKTPLDRSSRDFARRFWAEESSGAELLCARTDLRLPLDPLRWQGDRAAMYLCHQAIYSDRHRTKAPPRLDRVSVSHPLRVVVFGEVASDAAAVSDWIGKNADRYELCSRRERVLNKGLVRGKASSEDRYVVYELVPAGSRHGQRPR
jgi:hypothetical protein